MFKHKGPASTASSQVRSELLNLESIKRLAAELGDPQNSFKTVHVAGTNGKGSVTHKVAAALKFCGHRTGLFTSPHIDSFCERIQVDS